MEWEVSVARLCIHRSGVRPLDFPCSPASGLNPLSAEELIPERRRLSLSRCVHWPNNQFGTLTSLTLLCQRDPDPNIYSLSRRHTVFPASQRTLALKRLHIAVFWPKQPDTLSGHLPVSPAGSPSDSRAPPQSLFRSPGGDCTRTFSAGRDENRNLPSPGRIDTPRYKRYNTHRFSTGCHRPSQRMTEKPHGTYPLRGLWLHIGQEDHYKVPPPHALRNSEKFIIETDPGGKLNSAFSLCSPPMKIVHLSPFYLLSNSGTCPG